MIHSTPVPAVAAERDPGGAGVQRLSRLATEPSEWVCPAHTSPTRLAKDPQKTAVTLEARRAEDPYTALPCLVEGRPPAPTGGPRATARLGPIRCPAPFGCTPVRTPRTSSRQPRRDRMEGAREAGRAPSGPWAAGVPGYRQREHGDPQSRTRSVAGGAAGAQRGTPAGPHHPRIPR